MMAKAKAVQLPAMAILSLVPNRSPEGRERLPQAGFKEGCPIGLLRPPLIVGHIALLFYTASVFR
jgi:hypothetical protein